MTDDPTHLPASAAALVLALAACGVDAGSSVRVDQAENPSRTSGRAGQVPPSAQSGETLAAIVAAVRADAARAGRAAEPDALAVVTAESTWADGALGCPQPGRMYTQALVPGWRVVVRGPGFEDVYHASRHGQWLWCPAGRAQPPGATGAVAQ